MSKKQEAKPAAPEKFALSPHAKEVLAAVQLSDDAKSSRIPPAAYRDLEKKLKHLRHHRQSFEHLCVLWKYFEEQGLLRVAQQMLELAKIGLEPSAIEKASLHVDSMRKSAKALHTHQRNPNAKALSPSTTVGVGLGRRTKKQ